MRYGMYSGGGYGGGSGGEIFVHLLFGALGFIILLSLAVILVRFAIGGGRRRMWMNRMQLMNEDESAMQILKERYAKGEIDKAEFEQKKKDLQS